MALSVSRVSWVNAGVLAIVGAIAVWVLCFSAELIRADFASMSARYQIDAWMAKPQPWTVAQWLDARDDLNRALAIAPENPMLHDYLGALYALRGTRAWPNLSLRRAYFEQAAIEQRASLSLRKANAPTWASLALSLYAQDDKAAAVAALQNALLYGANEGRVRQLGTELVLAMWPDVSVAQQSWVIRLYQTASAPEQRWIEQIAKRYGVEAALASSAAKPALASRL